MSPSPGHFLKVPPPVSTITLAIKVQQSFRGNKTYSNHRRREEGESQHKASAREKRSLKDLRAMGIPHRCLVRGEREEKKYGQQTE